MPSALLGTTDTPLSKSASLCPHRARILVGGARNIQINK